MKNALKSKYLPFAVLGLGIAALLLRWLLYAVAVDDKNLLILGHPLEIVLWLVTVAAAALVIAVVRKLDGSNRYVDNFHASAAAAAGSCVMAAGILLTVLSLDAAKSTLEMARNILGIVSAPGLVWAGIERYRGKRPFFLCYGVAAVFFALYMISHYQTWSGNPQLQDYVYSLLAASGLTLFAYHLSAFSVGSGKRRMQLALGLLCVFFCAAALPHTEAPALYLTGGIWAFTNLCGLTPVPRREKKDAATQPQE